jgi:hypothetical protein
LAFVVVIDGVGAVVELDVPVFPAAASSAPVAATPLYSDTFALAALAVLSFTVTLVTAAAFVRYQSSTRVLEPDRNPTEPFVQVPPAESVTLDTDAVEPAWIATEATSVSPAVEAIGTSKLVADGVLPVPCRTNASEAGGGGPVGVVADATLLGSERWPAVSTALTV